MTIKRRRSEAAFKAFNEFHCAAEVLIKDCDFNRGQLASMLHEVLHQDPVNSRSGLYVVKN